MLPPLRSLTLILQGGLAIATFLELTSWFTVYSKPITIF